MMVSNIIWNSREVEYVTIQYYLVPLVIVEVKNFGYLDNCPVVNVGLGVGVGYNQKQRTPDILCRCMCVGTTAST
jgi:hypothetical protein